MPTYPRGFEKLPDEPGCYIYHDENGVIIYVGKAKDLKKRVSNYFSNKPLDPKTAQLVSRISSVEFIVTNSDSEAYLLENNLIKEHQPKYNIDLKDSRRYAYILVTREKFPRVLLARKRTSEGEYFGPFTSGKERDDVIYIINKTFRLRTCRKLPKQACLRKQIGLCDAPCIGDISEQDYSSRIDRAKQILRGDTRGIISELDSEMKRASGSQSFERAKELRDQMFALKRLDERQTIERSTEREEDIINYILHDGAVSLMLFHVRHGMLLNRQEFEFDAVDGWLEDFLVQYYSEGNIPNEIILPESADDGIAEFLSFKRGKQVKLLVPQKGEKKDLLDLAKKNIELSLFKNANKLEALRQALSLPELPSVIECFDISHLSGTMTVGSMVQFRNGEADKSNYRRFKIKSFEGNDDFRSIAEIVSRRYSRLIRESAEFPDIIMIDGGKGQLNAALAELKKLSLGIPVISLAKQFEEIYTQDSPEPLRLDRKSDALKYLQEIRDEAHRFAISYNRLLRSKSLRSELKSELKKSKKK